jgi:hypothetical protein
MAQSAAQKAAFNKMLAANKGKKTPAAKPSAKPAAKKPVGKPTPAKAAAMMEKGQDIMMQGKQMMMEGKEMQAMMKKEGMM